MTRGPALVRSHGVRVGFVLASMLWFCSSAVAASGGAGLSGAAKPTAAKPTRAKPTQVKAAVASLSEFTGVMRMGQRGAQVSKLQTVLSAVGYPVPATGWFGPMTKSAVRRFQLAHALYPASGTVGRRTASALSAAVSTGTSTTTPPSSSPSSSTVSNPAAPVGKAHINSDGTATAPADAPPAVKAVIAAANQIIDKPYIYAGGHASWIAPGYDCSGAVSYALHGGGLLSAPLAVQFEGYGSPGPGRWITTYADSQHVFAAIAGLAFDTADYGGPNIPAGTGPRWRYNPTGNLADGGGYVVRHPAGY